ncbi:uncharacterized protein LOC113562095 [Ooceraea biroi]|uniref:uncharacterized protein LOC113562095 n=1 Tax=Ooceraea biroi TaxID=2015173 RepID=UPI000F098C99|nr:uncharacterized protein LOC113562095 [Ooceraea biroi]
MNDPHRYFNKSREPASAPPSRTMTPLASTQHIATQTSPVSLDAPILRRGSSSKPAVLRVKELKELVDEELFNQEYALYSQHDDNYSDEQYIRRDLKSLKGKLDEMHKDIPEGAAVPPIAEVKEVEPDITEEAIPTIAMEKVKELREPEEVSPIVTVDLNHSPMKKKIKVIESDRKKLQEPQKQEIHGPVPAHAAPIPGPSRAAPVAVHPPPIHCQLPTGERVAVPYFKATQSRKFCSRTASGTWTLRFDATGQMVFCRRRHPAIQRSSDGKQIIINVFIF